MMATGILIFGDSGTGKSASMRNCDPNNWGIVNVMGKPLPFKNKFKTIACDDTERIVSIVESAQSRSIVIDDAGYLISGYYMDNKPAITAKMNDKYAVYDALATRFWRLVNAIHKIPGEKNVYVIMHSSQGEDGIKRPKTIGRMLDDKIVIEGLFSIVLQSERGGGGYAFRTNSDGATIAKSPIGMFPELIPNDLAAVDKAIREYYKQEV
jgi:hypothetical protein